MRRVKIALWSLLMSGTISICLSGQAPIDWRDLELCPPTLTSEQEVLIGFGAASLDLPHTRIRAGSQITLRTGSKGVSILGPSQSSYTCDCIYELEPSQYDLVDASTGAILPPTGNFPLGGLISYRWLDKYDDVTTEECASFTQKYGEPGSSGIENSFIYSFQEAPNGEIDSLYFEMSSSHKLGFSVPTIRSHFIDPTRIAANSPHKYINYQTLAGAAQSGFAELQSTRATDNSCPQKDDIKRPTDLLLLKNRWPTPGDHIDSILFGQFSDTIPPKDFKQEICLSGDLLVDEQDTAIICQVYAPDDFSKLSAGAYETLTEDNYFSHRLYQFYVDKSNDDCNINTCPEKIDLSTVKNGFYNIIAKTDSENTIVECDESNNVYSGLRIEIDDFNGGDCEVCPGTIRDLENGIWTLSQSLPDCTSCSLSYPPTAGKVYYDGQSYVASCVYERVGDSPVPLVWVRWQENVNAKDSIVFLNEEGEVTNMLNFCEPFDFEDGMAEVLVPDLDKAMVGSFGHSDFDNDQLADILDALVNCYIERPIRLDSMCQSFTGLLKSNPEQISFTVAGTKKDTIKLFLSGDGQATISNIQIEGDLDLDFSLSKPLPAVLSGSDTILLYLSLVDGQDLTQEKCSEIIITGNIGVPEVRVKVGIFDPVLDVVNLFSSLDPSDSNDTLYAGETSLLTCRIIDKISGKVIEDGNYKIKATTLIEQSSPGLKELDHEFEIIQGTSTGIQFNAFESVFGPSKDIKDETDLSGQVTLKFEQLEGDELEPVEVVLVYASPIDFKIASVDYQQGIVDQDKSVIQSFLGESRTFDPLPFVKDHDGHLVVKIDIENKGLIEYKEIKKFSKLKLAIRILNNGSEVANFELENIELSDTGVLDKGEINEKDYSTDDLFNMKNVFNRHISKDVLKMAGTYSIEAKLIYTDDELIVKSDDLTNDLASKTEMEVVGTEELRILYFKGRLNGISEYPEFDPDESFKFLRSVYPIEYKKLKFIEGGSIDFEKSASPRLTQFDIFNALGPKLIKHNEKTGGPKADLLVVQTDDAFFNYMAPQSAGVSDHYRKVAIFPRSNALKTAAHEVGHILGLGDTYKGGSPFIRPKVNPGRPPSRFGNIVEKGNIHLDNQKQLQHYSRSTYDFEQALFDFMGATVDDPFGFRIRHSWVDRVTWDHLYNLHFKLGSRARAQGTYLVVTGSIDSNKVVSLDPLLMIEDPPYVDEHNPLGEYQIAFYDETDNVIFSHRFDLEFFIFDFGPVEEIGFLFYLPFDQSYSRMEMVFQDSTVFNYSFSTNPPEITLFEATYSEEREEFDISWNAQDPDDDPLTYSLFYIDADGNSWTVNINSQDLQFTWSDFNQPWFTAEEGHFILDVSDGFNSVEAMIEVPSLLTSTFNIELESGWNIYPNPTVNSLKIKAPFKAKHTVIIENIRGQQVKKVLINQKEKELTLSSLSEGLYSLRIIDDEGTIVHIEKLVVIK